MKLGTIISLEESPSTSEFAFVVESGNESVRKGQFVQNETKNGLLFGFISEITRANRYFERAESVAEYERQSPMKDHFPISSWDHMIAQVKVLGTFRDGKFERAYKPPVPGSKVDEADEKVLKRFLGFTDTGLLLGKLQHHELDAKIDLTRLFQKHLAILAMSGAGKSHLSSVMLEELLNRSAEDGRIAVIVIDIHGEYVGFKFDPNYGTKTKVVEGKEIFVPLRKVAPEMLEEWLPNLSGPQREALRAAMHSMRGSKEKISMKELVTRIEALPDSKEETKKTLKRTLGEIRRHRFVTSGKENPRFLHDVKPGELLVMDFSPLDSMRKKQILVSYIARKLFNLRKKGKIPPFLLLVEEAHNFAREKAEAHEAISRSIIETIAREGRKFGASLCLVSQRPVNLSTTALSQCNTHVILRVTNPNDLDHIQQSSEGIDARIARSISGLKVGEAIIVGEAVNYPIFVNIRQRKSEKREKGMPLHQQAVEFEQNREKKEKNVETFL
jgi:DNA helicase HerA-like ATPase